MSDNFIFISVFTFICGLIFIVLLAIGANHITSIACEERSVSFEAHDFGMIKGCMVKHNGKWLPLENIRGFD